MKAQLMPTENTRRRDRFARKLHIKVWGTDAEGQDFVEETHTTFVARHGAKIVLQRGLVTDQELTVRCEGSGGEGDARVVGFIGEDEDGKHYAIQFLEAEANVWGIDSAPLAETEADVERVLLECLRCKARTLTYLDELEAEVFEANQIIWRNCKSCKAMTLWRRSTGTATTAQPDSPVASPPEAARVQNTRQHPRVDLGVKAAVRTSLLGEEVVATENVSRGGFVFKSSRAYTKGMSVEASVPYMPGGVNIYTPARIVRVMDLPQENVKVIAAAYIPVHKGRPAK